MDTSLSDFVKERRKQLNLTQIDLAEKSGVGLRFVRELEQGKQTLRMDKINQVLALFGHHHAAIKRLLPCSSILSTYPYTQDEKSIYIYV